VKSALYPVHSPDVVKDMTLTIYRLSGYHLYITVFAIAQEVEKMFQKIFDIFVTEEIFVPIVFCCAYFQAIISSGIEPIHKEVLVATDATISCVISGITRKLDDVAWTKDGTDVSTLSGNNYVVSEGIYGSNSQTTTLTVRASANAADSKYTCLITTNEHQESEKPTSVILNVFCKFCFPFQPCQI
jgi:hypothetical protein